MTNRLIIAPHADDEALGCGGVLAKYPDECIVAVLSDKGDGRLAEFERAKKVLGYKEHVVAPFATGTLTADSRAVTSWLDSLVREIKPCVMYLPTPDAHQDHSATYESGIRASRFSYTNPDAWYVPKVLLYNVPSYATDLYHIPYPWSVFEMLTDRQMDAKVTAIEEYASQNAGSFRPADMARANAIYIGARCGNGYAEQFALVRDVVA